MAVPLPVRFSSAPEGKSRDFQTRFVFVRRAATTLRFAFTRRDELYTLSPCPELDPVFFEQRPSGLPSVDTS